MIYEVSDNRATIDGYFFELDNTLFNIHVYKTGSMEYLDMLEVGFKINHDEFIYRCKEWLTKHK